jgi:multidrug efflux system membrane fusion protein
MAKKKRRIPKSYLWAGVFTLLIGAWLASGIAPEWLNASSEPDAAPASDAASEEEDLFRVSVSRFTAQPKPAEISVRGRTEANRRVEVRARTAGIVEEVPRQEGERIDSGTLLCQLDVGVRMTELAEEKAALESAEIDFKAADELAQQNFGSQTKRASEKAKLDGARASVERMKWEIGYTAIKAPISGILEVQAAELGSFLQVGGHCATIVDLDPLLVVVHVGQRDIAAVRTGMAAKAVLITGQAVDGKVGFVAPAADQTTRTFRVEIKVENAALDLREGVTTEVKFTLDPTPAHKLPSSALTLNDDGQIGIRSIGPGDIVRFKPVTILGDGRDGIWVGGLPDEIDIITVGQDYVLDGQKVEPVRNAAEVAAQ